MNLPTQKAGTFALFGLAGQNSAQFSPKADSSKWDGEFGEWGFKETASAATVGGSHRILLSDKSYLRTVAVATREAENSDEYWLDPEKNYEKHLDTKNDILNYTYRFSSTYNRKFDPRNTLRAGAVYSFTKFNFTYDDDDNFDDDKGDGLIRLFDNHGEGGFVQAFGQWKHRFDDRWTLNTGLHYSLFLLNKKMAIEPRVALDWKLSDRQSLSAAVGLHSKREHLAAYVLDGKLLDGTPRSGNADLELTKAMHAVLAYDQRLGGSMRLKAEVYYQYLYDVPVETLPGSTNSFLNYASLWEFIFAEQTGNEGTGRNYGVDLTLEKFFTKNYYFMLTGSAYRSLYTPVNGIEYSTRYDGRYTLHALGGKEFKVGKNKQNILGINGKALLAGGSRLTSKPPSKRAIRWTWRTSRLERRRATTGASTWA